jgi:hypothetical protein
MAVFDSTGAGVTATLPAGESVFASVSAFTNDNIPTSLPGALISPAPAYYLPGSSG